MQDREFMRLGGTNTIKVDVRVIAATNTDLEELIAEKRFRQDLFFRMNVIKIELPPLRERRDDISLLTKHFLEIYAKENKKEIIGVTEEVMEILEKYDWPGNIRELENLIERAVVLTKSKLIDKSCLPPFIIDTRKGEGAHAFSVQNENLKKQVQLFQKEAILDALKRANGVQKRAASFLGVKPTTLNEMIKRLKINLYNITD